MALQSPGHCSSIGSPNRPIAATAGIAWPAWLEVVGITLLAALLRLMPWLADFPLHRDEALYGYWARLVAGGQDPLLLTPWIDKPPLSIYLIAGSFAGLGISELTLRLPGLIASILTVPALYALAERSYDRRSARLAGGLFALSPFAILFAPTAFTDPWLVLWLVVGAWAALSGRGFATGLAAGLAVASKQQGVLVGPLLIALLLAPARPSPARWRSRLRDLLSAVAGFALVFGPLTWWDSLRWHNRPSFWDRSLTTYGPLLVAPPALWPTRAADWAEQLGYLFGLPALSWAMLALAALAGVRALRTAVRRRPGERASWTDLILAAYTAGYLALHLVVTFQPWDRYLLPLVPLICLLAARGITLIQPTQIEQMLMPFATPRRMKTFTVTAEAVRRSLGRLKSPLQKDGPVAMTLVHPLLALALAAALGYAAWLGAAGRIPVGSDHGAYTGIRQVAAFLRAQPAEAVIYHQSLGWYFDFYLYDAPQERRWFDTAEKLADEALRTVEAQPSAPQWLIVPAWEADRIAAWQPVLAAHGVRLTDQHHVYRPDGSTSFVIYRIVPEGEKG